MTKKQIINPLVGFGQRAIGPYANRIGQSTYARNVNVGELDLPADFQAFGTVGNVIKALVKGEGAVTFERQTEAEVIDFEKISKTALAHEIRYEFGRRVENICGAEILDADNWRGQGSATVANGDNRGEIDITVTVDGSTDRGETDYPIYPGAGELTGKDFLLSFEAKTTTAESGNGITAQLNRFTGGAGAIASASVVLTDQWQRFSLDSFPNFTDPLNEGLRVQFWGDDTPGDFCDEFTVRNIQIEEVTGQSNQNPSEYVSVGVITQGGLSGNDSTFDTGLGNWVNGDITRGDLTWNSGDQALSLTNTSGKLGFARAALAYEFKAGVQYYYSATWRISEGTAAIATAATPDGPITNIRPSANDGTYSGYFTPSADQSYLIFYINSANDDNRVGELDNIQIGIAEHGAFVDGVRNYAITNPNEVDGNNVVTPTAATTPLNDYRALFEPAATSYIAEPEDFTAGANWTGTGNLDGSESTTDSSLQGRKLWKLAATLGSTGTHTYVSSTHTKDAAVETWIGSIICRPDDPEVSWIALTVENGAGGEFGQQFFQLSDGSKGTFNSVTWTVDDAGSEQLANGDYRYWIKVTTNTTANIRLRVSAANADNGDFFNLPQDKGFFVQGANLVEENALSSYIGGTGLSSYSRTADNASPMFDDANFSDTEGTWHGDFWTSLSGVNMAIMNARDVVGDGQVYIASPARIRSQDDGNNLSATPAPSITIGEQYRFAIDFVTGGNMVAGKRNVESDGSWLWGSEVTYSGGYDNDISAINIVYGLNQPFRLRALTGHTTRKGKDWVEDNL